MDYVLFESLVISVSLRVRSKFGQEISVSHLFRNFSAVLIAATIKRTKNERKMLDNSV